MTEQIDLFSAEDDRLREQKMVEMFRRWESLPPQMLIPAGDPQRNRVLSMLNEGYGFLWDRALHRCEGIPPTRYIWLNAVQPAEYWVMNDFWNPAGKHVETCPLLRGGPEGRRRRCAAGQSEWRLVDRQRIFERRCQ